MMHAPTRPRLRSPVPGSYLPALIAALAVLVAGLLETSGPVGLVALGALCAWFLVIAMERAPIVLFWSVPLSMCWWLHWPVLPYELLILLIGFVMWIQSRRSGGATLDTLSPVEMRQLVFLGVLLVGIPWVISLLRFAAVLKIFVVGFVGFEVARHATRRFGRETLLWGPLGFVMITVGMLTYRMMASGVPAFRSILLRSYLTRLSWGSSNYIAAVIVLCLPSLVLLVQECPAGTRRRFVAIGAILVSLSTMLFTLSRGGFLLSAAYLLSLTKLGRRTKWWQVAGVLGLVLAVMFTPLGLAVIARFTNAESLNSILSRFRIWEAAWTRAMVHMPIGTGLGQGWLQPDELGTTDPHNFLLTLLGETGPLGLVAWLWLLASLWQAAERLASEPASRSAGIALRATIALAVTNSLFEPTFTGNLYFTLFWWLAGISFGSRPSSSATQPVAVARG